jgi:hypothetical protein
MGASGQVFKINLCLFNAHNRFNISVYGFYFIADLHGMISYDGIGLNGAALINDNYISGCQIIMKSQYILFSLRKEKK